MFEEQYLMFSQSLSSLNLKQLNVISFTNSPWDRACCCSVAQSCLTLCDPMDCSMPGFLPFPNSQSLLKLMSIKLMMPSNHLILCHLLFSYPQSFPASGSFPMSQLFLCIRWPKCWSFSFNINTSELVSFRIAWFNLLAIQGCLKSLLQHHSLKALFLWCSAFFMIQLSYPHMTTGKTIALIYGPLLAKWYLCFLLRCLGLS